MLDVDAKSCAIEGSSVDEEVLVGSWFCSLCVEAPESRLVIDSSRNEVWMAVVAAVNAVRPGAGGCIGVVAVRIVLFTTTGDPGIDPVFWFRRNEALEVAFCAYDSDGEGGIEMDEEEWSLSSPFRGGDPKEIVFIEVCCPFAFSLARSWEADTSSFGAGSGGASIESDWSSSCSFRFSN